MNWKLLLFPVALVVETVSVVATKLATGTARECGFGDFVFDRKPGDPIGKLTQTRQQAIAERGYLRQ